MTTIEEKGGNSADRDSSILSPLDVVAKEVKQVYLTLLSTYTKNPLNLAINAPTGEGKSYVVRKVTDHPDHTLITYPNLGHGFYPSSQWSTSFGPVSPYVLADLYAWLESHSGFTHIAAPISSSNVSSSSPTTR